MRRRHLAIATLVLLAACGDRSATQRTEDTPTPTRTAAGSPAADEECPRVTGGADSHVLLTGVRLGAEKSFDRITFEFKPTSRGKVMPRYELDVATPPIYEDPTGDPVEIDGETFAQIVFHGAGGFDIDQDPAVETYTGPKEFKPGFEVLVEAERTGDFEATLSWAFGLSRESCWSATELADPLRLTIVFPH